MFAAFMLYRRRDIKRMFAYSSIEHMGIITFAFGMGGPLANFAGLLHMTMHSLTKSAIFFAVGHIAQVKGTQKIADIGGLTVTHPVLGWGLVLGVVAIAGLPPLGIFMSEFLIVSSTFARAAVARDPAGVRPSGRASARCSCGSTRSRSASRAAPTAPAQGLLRADVRASRARARRRHLSAAGAGRLVPERREAAGIAPWRADRHDPAGRAASTAHRPWPRAIVDDDGWRQRSPAISRPAAGRCSACGASRRRAHGAARRDDAARSPSSAIDCPDGTLSLGRRAASAGDPARARDPRSVSGSSRWACRTRGPGSITASGT